MRGKRQEKGEEEIQPKVIDPKDTLVWFAVYCPSKWLSCITCLSFSFLFTCDLMLIWIVSFASLSFHAHCSVSWYTQSILWTLRWFLQRNPFRLERGVTSSANQVDPVLHLSSPGGSIKTCLQLLLFPLHHPLSHCFHSHSPRVSFYFRRHHHLHFLPPQHHLKNHPYHHLM